MRKRKVKFTFIVKLFYTNITIFLSHLQRNLSRIICGFSDINTHDATMEILPVVVTLLFFSFDN